MRALMSLGKPPATYCAMLTPMVLGKLPPDFRKQFARDHSSGDGPSVKILNAFSRRLESWK